MLLGANRTRGGAQGQFKSIEKNQLLIWETIFENIEIFGV